MHRSARPFVFIVAGALAFAGLAAAPPAAAVAGTDLILSEVIEGSSNNKAVEIYNPTPGPVSLTGYDLVQYSNGSTAATTLATLSGTLGSGAVFVVASASAGEAIKAEADALSSAGMFNGDDAVALRKNGAPIDVFGQIGFDPGTYWGSGNDITQDRTLRREAAVCTGDPNGSDAFDPTVGWDTYPIDTISDLGKHTSLCDVNPDPDPDPEPDPDPVADCALDVSAISSLQGSGAATPVPNTEVRVEGVVVGDFQTGGFDGFYLQDAGDGNPSTSDGIFIYQDDADNLPGNGDGILDVSIGDVVHVVGTVSEAFGMTQIKPFDTARCATGAALPEPAALTLPATTADREALEGMYVTLPQSLAILEYFEFGQFGTIDVGVDRQYQPTATFDPGSADAIALRDANLAERITIDDGRSNQNPDPAIHPDGGVFTLEHTFRGGDLVTDATGVLDYRFSTYAIQPTQGAHFEAVNPRPEVPEVGGDLKVSSFNVLNYFTDLDPSPGDDSNPERGANTAEELARQQAKIVAALAEIDADVFGLIEIQNNGDTDHPAVATLTAALNAKLGGDQDVYDWVRTGKVGTDVITTAFVYKKATVQPVGAPALLTGAVDPRWLDNRNRPALTQTFRATAGGEPVTISVNHLKSKGSSCASNGDPDTGDGQGNCNGVRTAAAQALAEWLATDPTHQGTADRSLIIGDLNSYDKEDPIQALEDAGYTDLIHEFQGEDAYSYVFDGQLGYLDHALASAGLVEDISGASPWNINSDEPSIIDYDMTYKAPAQDALFAPDPYRSSDHDPVLVGIDLDTTPPVLTLTPSVDRIMPPDNKTRVVTVDVAVEDESDVTVELVSAEASGSKKAAVTTVDDTTFRVVAANKAVYTFTYTATDAAGNSTTETVKVVVGPATD